MQQLRSVMGPFNAITGVEQVRCGAAQRETDSQASLPNPQPWVRTKLAAHMTHAERVGLGIMQHSVH